MSAVVSFCHSSFLHCTLGYDTLWVLVHKHHMGPWRVHNVDSWCMIISRRLCVSVITSLPKVIWEEGRVAPLSHVYAVKSPLVTTARPKFAQKVPLPVDQSPNPTTCLIFGPVRPVMPNGIWIRSAVFPQCTGQTDRSSTGKFDHLRNDTA